MGCIAMAKRPVRTNVVREPILQPEDASSATFKTVLIALVALAAAAAMFVFRTAIDQTFLLILLGLLGVVGVFYLFGAVMGLVHFGPRGTVGHPGAAYLDALADGVCITNQDRSVLYANAAYGDIAGIEKSADVRSLEQLLSKHDTASNALYRLVNALAADEAGLEEFRLARSLSGREEGPRWYRMRAWPMPTKNADKTLHVWSLKDITGEREDQERVFVELQQAIEHLDRAPVGFFSSNAAGMVEYVNATLAGWIGLDLVRFTSGSVPVEALIGDEGLAMLADMMAANPNGARNPVTLDLSLPTASGDRLPAQLVHSARRNHEGLVEGGRTIVINRTDADETSLVGTGSDIRLFNATPMAIAALDDSGRIIRTNMAFVRLFTPIAGIDDLARDMRFDALLSDADRETFARRYNDAMDGRDSGDPLDVVLPTKVRNDLTDDQLHVRIFINTVRQANPSAHGDAEATDDEAALVYVMDMTEQKGLENQMAQSQKMQAVGQLAGGIAHDFNNVLTAIIMASDLLLSNHRPSDPSFPDIMNIKQNANRAASLVRQLLAFSRRQTLRPQVLSVTDVLADLRMLLTRLVGGDVKMNIEHARELWPVKVDLGQFEQVIVNLCVNARDAMPGGGTLTIRTANLDADALSAMEYRGLQRDQDYVLIDVEDTGTGIEPDILKKIFEPFFTTKEVGQGTGLGLSMVYGIIKQTGGHIYADSIVGEGTTFRLFLPRHVPTVEEVEAEAKAKSAPAVAAKKQDLSGNATVLLVEDEDAVRMGGVRALQSRGYTVHEAASGIEAMEIMEDIGKDIDIIVSDVVMPEMDGPTLLREVRKLRPDIKFVFVSGYAEDAFAKNLPEDAQFGFLPKPFTLKQLATTVKEMLSPGNSDQS